MRNDGASNPKGFSPHFQFCLGYDIATCFIGVCWAKPTEHTISILNISVGKWSNNILYSINRKTHIQCIIYVYSFSSWAQVLINPEIPGQILLLLHHQGPFPTTGSEQPVSFASGKSKLHKPCSFHILTLNPSSNNILKAYSNCCLKGKPSKEEQHIKYLVHDEGNYHKAMLEWNMSQALFTQVEKNPSFEWMT